MIMIGKINCVFNDCGAWCKNKYIKRSLFGIGARCCIEYPPLNGKKCDLKKEYSRTVFVPPHVF
jgi:hypothetical protein